MLHSSTACLTSRTANIYTMCPHPPTPVAAGGGRHAGTNRAAIQRPHLSLSLLMSQGGARNRTRPHSHTPTPTDEQQPPPCASQSVPPAGSQYCGSLVWMHQCSRSRDCSDHYCTDKHINSSQNGKLILSHPSLSSLSHYRQMFGQLRSVRSAARDQTVFYWLFILILYVHFK